MNSSKIQGGQSAAGWRLSRRQHSRGKQRTFERHHRHIQHGSRLLSLLRDTEGQLNTAVGAGALVSNTTGRNNIALGFEAGSAVSIADNVICIGAGVIGDNVDDRCFIGNIAISTSPNGTAVLINSSGRLGTITSSARFKDEIQPMDKASEALFALRPVAFRYKKDIDLAGTPQLGLVAKDVDKVNPDLVVRDKEGKPTVSATIK